MNLFSETAVTLIQLFTLRKKCPCLTFFSSVFSRIRTEYADIYFVHFRGLNLTLEFEIFENVKKRLIILHKLEFQSQVKSSNENVLSKQLFPKYVALIVSTIVHVQTLN